ncbi:MAG: nuclear transport factor 2 family protein, partial [Alphaproteobacteria bacterium]|nr:nuclear transport factor 2 family protein [Alphaproteobacteria bacterium]
QAGHPWGAARAQAAPSNMAAQAELVLSEGLVQNLQAAFGYYLDRKMNDDIVDLFTEDAVLDLAGTGQYLGKAGLRRALALFGEPGLKTGELNDRPQLMPVVTMGADGRSATVRNIEIGMTGQHGGETYWSATIQDFSCVRGSDGRWRIAALRRMPLMRATYAKGWQDPIAAGLPSVAAAQPDRPSQLADASYPGHAPAPVRFADALAPEPAFVGKGEAATLIARAAAFDGAENIANAYGYYIDEFRWDDTADLFSTDGWKELSYIGTYVGRERVRGSLFGRYGNAGRSAAFMAIHQKTQPYVTVSQDGMRANIRLRLFQFNSAAKGQGSWISGIYENQAVVENGIWRIHGMDLDYVWLADYAGGWAAIVPGASERYRPKAEDVAKNPPDGPLRGVTFAPYPAIAPMGFHFANPVSGRAPATFLHWSDGRRAAASE